MRTSFIIHKDSLCVLDELSDEECGKLFRAIKAYQLDETYNTDRTTGLLFAPFRNQFERDNEKYTKTCEMRAEAGSLGGKQKVVNASKSYQKVANVADSDSDSDSDSDISNTKEPSAKVSAIDILEVYDAYPARCAKGSRSTGKCDKNKNKIATLLKTNTKEDLKGRIDWYVNDCTKTDTYLKNFSTFLNNLPEIDLTALKPKVNEKIQFMESLLGIKLPNFDNQ